MSFEHFHWGIVYGLKLFVATVLSEGTVLATLDHEQTIETVVATAFLPRVYFLPGDGAVALHPPTTATLFIKFTAIKKIYIEEKLAMFKMERWHIPFTEKIVFFDVLE